MRKIAIIGLNPKLMPLAPWDDHSWEKWFLPWGPKKYILKSDALFEIHPPDRFGEYTQEGYAEELEQWRDMGLAVWTQENYPLDRAILIGEDYFQCTLSYMVAMAALERPYAIGVFGSSPDDTRIDEKANLEFWIGIARQRCIELVIQEGSTPCKYQPLEGYPVRYGWVA